MTDVDMTEIYVTVSCGLLQVRVYQPFLLLM